MEEALLRSAQREARLEAAPFVVAVTVAFLCLAALSRWHEWELAGGAGWWIWLVLAVPPAVLAGALLSGLGTSRMAERRRHVALWLLASLLGGTLAAVGLVVFTITASSVVLGGGQLLTTALVVLLADVVAFALLYWELDNGGPVRRSLAETRVTPDFQFPQDENPTLARAGWAPALPDYLYLALTNAVAFSPTDAMPLSRPAKSLMAFEAMVSITTLVVVAARAVNVLGG